MPRLDGTVAAREWFWNRMPLLAPRFCAADCRVRRSRHRSSVGPWGLGACFVACVAYHVLLELDGAHVSVRVACCERAEGGFG